MPKKSRLLRALGSWGTFAALCLLSVFLSFQLSGGTPIEYLSALLPRLEPPPPSPDRRGEDNFPSPDSPIADNPGSEAYEQADPDRRSTHMWDHTANDGVVCSKPPTKSRAEVPPELIYQWEDDSGQIHLADEAPPGVIAKVLDISGEQRDFTYEIIADGTSLSHQFQGQINAGSKRIYDVWHFFLGESRLRQSHIKLKVIGGPARFDAFRASASPNSPPVDGFYSPGKNVAYVKHDPSRAERTVRTSFHEISHLITASHLGPTPPWLTEGLAEYFETMTVRDQAGFVHPNQSHLRRLKTVQLPHLRHYLSISRPDWYGEKRQLNYAIAWSVIYFLMQSDSGRYTMKAVIEEMHTHFCRSSSPLQVVDSSYPGGLNRLDADWRNWLESGA